MTAILLIQVKNIRDYRAISSKVVQAITNSKAIFVPAKFLWVAAATEPSTSTEASTSIVPTKNHSIKLIDPIIENASISNTPLPSRSITPYIPSSKETSAHVASSVPVEVFSIPPSYSLPHSTTAPSEIMQSCRQNQTLLSTHLRTVPSLTSPVSISSSCLISKKPQLKNVTACDINPYHKIDSEVLVPTHHVFSLNTISAAVVQALMVYRHKSSDDNYQHKLFDDNYQHKASGETFFSSTINSPSAPNLSNRAIFKIQAQKLTAFVVEQLHPGNNIYGVGNSNDDTILTAEQLNNNDKKSSFTTNTNNCSRDSNNTSRIITCCYDPACRSNIVQKIEMGTLGNNKDTRNIASPCLIKLVNTIVDNAMTGQE